MGTTIYRKRYIPDEVVDISGDEILFQNEDLLVTGWKAIRPRADLSGGISYALLREGVKISRFYDLEGRFIYWYCDIVDVDYNRAEDRYLFTDLLMDVRVHPDGKVEVLDADELAEALEMGLIDSATACRALRRFNWLMSLIHLDQFPPKVCRLVDLHTHSTASDGSMGPSELVRHAKSAGLSAIALTDHDTVDGIEEAVTEGRKIGLEVIAGIEVSCDHTPEMHMLGYFFGDSWQSMKGMLEELRENRENRNPKIIQKLNELGYDISMEEVRQKAGGNIVARPHFARVLIEKGYVKDMEEAFRKLLGDGKPAYFKKDKLTPEQCIAAIRRAGGMPVLAHPIHLKMGWQEVDELFGRLKGWGLVGVEAQYVDNTVNDTLHFMELAQKNGLLATGGSDFHGTFKPNIRIGVGYGRLKVPYSLLEDLRLAGG